MNPLDYYRTEDDIAIFSKLRRMAILIHKLMGAVDRLKAENEALKASMMEKKHD